MNSSWKYHDFISADMDADEACGRDMQAFFTQANSIRMRFGKQGYLLDTYLSYLLRAVNNTSAFVAVSDGQEAGVCLRMLCRDIIDREKEQEKNPFYEQARSFIESHPLNSQERHTCVALYLSMLAPDFLREEIARFLAEQERSLQEVLDAVELKHLRSKLVELLDNDGVLDDLDGFFRKAFIRVSLMAGFLQGFINELLGELTYRDHETSKEIFRLLPDC